jgi:hypothetical protein
MKNDGIFIFFCASTVNISYRVLHSVTIIHMGPRFLLCHDENFCFVSNANDESEYTKKYG